MQTRKTDRSLKNIFLTIILGFAIVAFWRGVWGLMDLYLFPGNHVLSLWVSVFLGVFILYITKNLINRLV